MKGLTLGLDAGHVSFVEETAANSTARMILRDGDTPESLAALGCLHLNSTGAGVPLLCSYTCTRILKSHDSPDCP